MADAQSNGMTEPPVFGPNGTVLNAPHMTDEMREKIENPDYSYGFKEFRTNLAAMVLFSAALMVPLYSGAPKSLSILVGAIFITAFMLTCRRAGLCFRQTVWRALPISAYFILAVLEPDKIMTHPIVLFLIVAVFGGAEWIYHRIQKPNPSATHLHPF